MFSLLLFLIVFCHGKLRTKNDNEFAPIFSINHDKDDNVLAVGLQYLILIIATLCCGCCIFLVCLCVLCCLYLIIIIIIIINYYYYYYYYYYYQSF